MQKVEKGSNMVFIQDIVRGTELTIASGGPPGGLPAATADPRQTPSPAARLAQARQKMDAPFWPAAHSTSLLRPFGFIRSKQCAAGQKGAPIFCRACARRAAGDGVCRGSAVAAGRPPGGPPEAMVSSVPRTISCISLFQLFRLIPRLTTFYKKH